MIITIFWCSAYNNVVLCYKQHRGALLRTLLHIIMLLTNAFMIPISDGLYTRSMAQLPV